MLACDDRIVIRHARPQAEALLYSPPYTLYESAPSLRMQDHSIVTKDWSIRLSNREKLGMDQVFVVWTSKSGLNQLGLVF